MEKHELCKLIAETLFSDVEAFKRILPNASQSVKADVEHEIKERTKLAKEAAALGLLLRPSKAIEQWNKGMPEAIKHMREVKSPGSRPWV